MGHNHFFKLVQLINFTLRRSNWNKFTSRTTIWRALFLVLVGRQQFLSARALSWNIDIVMPHCWRRRDKGRACFSTWKFTRLCITRFSGYGQSLEHEASRWLFEYRTLKWLSFCSAIYLTPWAMRFERCARNIRPRALWLLLRALCLYLKGWVRSIEPWTVWFEIQTLYIKL